MQSAAVRWLHVDHLYAVRPMRLLVTLCVLILSGCRGASNDQTTSGGASSGASGTTVYSMEVANRCAGFGAPKPPSFWRACRRDRAAVRAGHANYARLRLCLSWGSNSTGEFFRSLERTRRGSEAQFRVVPGDGDHRQPRAAVGNGRQTRGRARTSTFSASATRPSGATPTSR